MENPDWILGNSNIFVLGEKNMSWLTFDSKIDKCFVSECSVFFECSSYCLDLLIQLNLLLAFLGRFAVLANNNLQILNINKSDEGVYRCEGRVEARGEIDFRDIIVIVNGKEQKCFNWLLALLGYHSVF